MTRWERLRAEPERLWVGWNPDEWWLHPGVVALAVMGLLFILAPWALDLFGRGRHSGQTFMEFFLSMGFTVATALALVRRAWRLRRRAVLATRLDPADWVCANCLHAELERSG